MTSKIDKLLRELATKYPSEPAYIATVPMQCAHEHCCTYAKRIRAAVAEELAQKDKMRDALIRLREWAAMDWNENAYLGQKGGNHLKLINGILNISNEALKDEEAHKNG